jgi:2-keto-4-pentenoate hydratase
MAEEQIDRVVDALRRARAEGRPRAAGQFAPAVTSLDAAYAVQAGVARALRWFDAEVPLHWKSGGPSRDAVLTHAALPPRGVWASPAQAGDWPFRLRGIEAEVALRLGPSVTAAQAAALDEAGAAALIEAMAVSIEIVDSRWVEGMAAPALLRLADLQSHGALVLGAWRPYAPRDWARQACRVSIGTRAAVERGGTHALGSPLWGLGAWLRHATRDGGVVRAGTVVTTGTWVGVLEAAAGERVHVEFDGIGEAEVLL